MSNLQGARGEQTGWSRQFDEPIPTGDGELRSQRDAGVYILALPPAEAEREHWQVAMECLIAAAEKGGIVMMAPSGGCDWSPAEAWDAYNAGYEDEEAA